MKSILIAVGCDRYDKLKPDLHGAEADARKVFTALTGSEQLYSPEASRLLLSPTKVELEQALLGLGAEPIDVLTFYFAGHGGTKEGGYYFGLRDSLASLLSLTGYPLNAWLNVVRELKPRYAYVVIDSCHSGGSHHDIRDVLNDPRLGQDPATTFACLAAAAANQYANESDGAGLMTAEFLKVIDGRLPAGTEQAELDLTDIARVVGVKFAHLDVGQRPVAWGLNLFGPGRLCRNPHYAASGARFHVPEVPAGSPLAERIAAHSGELWEFYRKVADGVDWKIARSLVREISDDPAVSAADRSAFIFGLAQTVASRLENRNTPWEAAEAFGAFAALLLVDLDDPAAQNTARRLLTRKLTLELSLFGPTLAAMGQTPPSLINLKSSMSDFYYLPQRILKLLATIAQAVALAPGFGLTSDLALAHSLAKRILADYSSALRAVADDQAPALFVWSHFARSLGWQDELDLVFGCIFSDVVAIQGKVARCDLPPRKACEYLLARGRDPDTIKMGWLANPSQLLGVALLLASQNDFASRVDPYLETLDHQRLNLYFPDNYRTFADNVMEAGANRTHAIGMDIWRVADFRQLFDADWRQHLADEVLSQTELEQAIISATALVFTDRIPLALLHRH